jgi:outer membrane receptor for ferrienterochelin and colicins
MPQYRFIGIYLLCLWISPALAQQGNIQGKITNPSGLPMPYANVLLDTNKGTNSNENGNYQILQIPVGKYVLQVSSVGYESFSQKVEIQDGQTFTLNLSLKELDAELNTVVVSATRSERELSVLPVPVTVISKEQIKSMGSLRLNEVLVEQTGLAIVSDHGTGVQVQGFNPEYTLILVDGEPLIGRTAGTLELNRIAVGNIRQIEIVKGPSSSLYGSEALAGVINIITEKADGTKGTLTSRFGTNQTLDMSGSADFQRKKLGVYAFANRYSTNGYDLSPESVGKTVSPFSNYTFNTKLTYDVSSRTRLSVSGRYFIESQQSLTDIGTPQETVVLDGKGDIRDWNLNPVLTHQLSPKLKTTFRFYGSGYQTNSSLKYQTDGQLYEESYFNQSFYRPEVQAEYFVNRKNNFTLGIGRIWESVEATRYDDSMHYQTSYAYFQYEWQPIRKLNLIAGGRYDDHSAYQSQFSPKLSAQYEVFNWLSLRGSAGVGFKAPDFRQLYLNFTNTAVGYSVLGSQEVVSGIARMQANREIADLLVDLTTFGEIKAESSVAYNLGIKVKPYKQVTLNANLFRNDIKDLIDTQPIARKTNGQLVYSYYNLSQVFTQGIESDLSYGPSQSLNFSLGYQYLVAKDKAVVEQLQKGEIFARDPATQATVRVSPDAYGGLYNRSRHMLNAKVFYEGTKGTSTSLRVIYRGRYGFADQNNNTILDADQEYVNGYITCNISAGKTFGNWLKVQAGCDNVFDYTQPTYIPALPGRLLWASATFTLTKNQAN